MPELIRAPSCTRRSRAREPLPVLRNPCMGQEVTASRGESSTIPVTGNGSGRPAGWCGSVRGRSVPGPSWSPLRLSARFPSHRPGAPAESPPRLRVRLPHPRGWNSQFSPRGAAEGAEESSCRTFTLLRPACAGLRRASHRRRGGTEESLHLCGLGGHTLCVFDAGRSRPAPNPHNTRL